MSSDRPLKLDLSSDEEFNTRGFDRDNGGAGTAQRIIDELRATGDVNPSTAKPSHGAHTEDRLMRGLGMSFSAKVAEASDAVVQAILDKMRRDIVAAIELPEPPTFTHGKQYLHWAADEALKYFDEDPNKSVAIFLALVQRDQRTARIASDTMIELYLMDGMSSRDRMDYIMKGFAA